MAWSQGIGCCVYYSHCCQCVVNGLHYLSIVYNIFVVTQVLHMATAVCYVRLTIPHKYIEAETALVRFKMIKQSLKND